MVGDWLAVVTVVGAASCSISVWLFPPQARRATVTRRIVKLVAGLKMYDSIPSCVTFCVHQYLMAHARSSTPYQKYLQAQWNHQGLTDRRTALSKRIQVPGR